MKSLFFIILFFIILSSVFADVVYLKSGQKIEGKVLEVEPTDWYARVIGKESQDQYTLRLDNIEKIEFDSESLKVMERNLKLADSILISSYRTKELKILMEHGTFESEKYQELVEANKRRDVLQLNVIVESIMKEIDFVVNKLSALLQEKGEFYNVIQKSYFDSYYLSHKDYKKEFKECTQDIIKGLQLEKGSYRKLLGNPEEQTRLMKEGESIINKAQQRASELDKEFDQQSSEIKQ